MPIRQPVVRRRLRGLLTDIRPLQHSAEYRRLWLGTVVSQLGQQMTAVAVAIQVYALTSSSFAVGLVGLCQLLPLVVFGLYGGAIADSMDRRRLALMSSTGLWLLSMVLMLQALLSVDRVGLLYGVVALQAACFAVNNPTRAAIIPRLLPAQMLPAANALSMATFNLGVTVGPLLGALLIEVGGFAAAFRSTMLQTAAPDALRGRLQGVFTVVVAGGPRAGDFVVGSVAAVAGEQSALLLGGAACVVGVLLAALSQRGFLGYDAESPRP